MGMRKQGVLLIHGLTGSPREFTPVDAALQSSGYHTRVVALPGHGENPSRRFHETSAIEILDHCAAEYEAISHEVDEVFIVGHSLGGICTLLTAAVQPPKLKGIVAFSAPYEHAFMYNYVQGFARMPLHHLIQGLSYAPRYRVQCRRPEVPLHHVPKLLQQSRVMFDLLKSQVPNIEVPVSLAHSIYDLTIPYQEMHKLAERIGKPERVKTHTLKNSGHRIFPLSRDMDEALKVIFSFIEHDCERMAQAARLQAAYEATPDLPHRASV